MKLLLCTIPWLALLAFQMLDEDTQFILGGLALALVFLALVLWLIGFFIDEAFDDWERHRPPTGREREQAWKDGQP